MLFQTSNGQKQARLIGERAAVAWMIAITAGLYSLSISAGTGPPD